MIRRAISADIPKITELLQQVCSVHHDGRPDLFKGDNATKYTPDELKGIIADETTPVFVYVGDAGEVLGYAFCKFVQHVGDNILTDVKTLYIDDLCVDARCRGQQIGSMLYLFVLDFAKESGCYNLTLNVWSCNASAIAFYERMGLKPQKVGMETIL